MDTQDRLPQSVAEPVSSLPTKQGTLDTYGIVVFVVVLVEILLMIGLNLYEKNRLTSLTSTLDSKKTELNKSDNKAVNDQLEAVLSGSSKLSSVLASKIDWTKFYTQLNAVTPNNVQLTSISISDNGAFKADGQTDSLSSLAAALVAWQSGTSTITTPFSAVTLANNGYTTVNGTRKTTFSISGQINTGGLQ